jgi:phosphoinositide-3-kinase, regulatory subunit 4
MVALDPAHRPTFDQVLFKSRESAFPECFYSFLYDYVSSINELSSASLFTKASPATPVAEAHDTTEPSPLPSDSDHRIDKIWTEYESVEPHLLTEAVEETVVDARGESLPTNGSFRRLEGIFPVELHIANRDSMLHGALATHQRAAPEGSSLFHSLLMLTHTSDGPALIMLSLVCANIRNCSFPSSKVRALDLLLALSSQLTDEAKLDRLIPYVIDLLHDDAAIVRGAALRTLMQVVRKLSTAVRTA